jgi:hypothetical protein
MEVTTDDTPWTSAPIVKTFIPACPYCRSEDYERSKTLSGGDGSSTKRVECRSCGRRYCITLEPLPVSGEWTTWPRKLPT